MSTYYNRPQPVLQNLLQHVVRFFHQRSSCMTMHISADVQRITLNASCTTISGGRTKQLDIFCRITSFTSDFSQFHSCGTYSVLSRSHSIISYDCQLTCLKQAFGLHETFQLRHIMSNTQLPTLIN